MPGRIPKQFIDDMLTRIDIVDVIDARVPLKKAGANHVACCPFHNEKTPSFTVSQTKQFYHCFGCGVHGTAISFLMEYDRMSFPEAIESLAHTLGLEVPREDGVVENKKDYSKLYQAMEAACSFYKQKLKESPQAIAYLKDRRISGKTAAEFKLGFAPPGWDNLVTHCQTSQPNDPTLENTLVTAGLATQGNRGLYDRFRNRIIFPIQDRRGRIIAFGARVITPEEEPKYLNSPETPVYHKGRELYGLFRARQIHNRLEYLLIVEGYMDVVMLAEHGINNAVATLGTATTAEQLRSLFKATSELVFCFDGDNAGQKAAWRAFENSLPELQDRHRIKFLFLPQGDDPDSLIQKEDKKHFEKRIQNAQPLSEYFLSQLDQRFDNNSLDGRAQMADFAKPLLDKINADILRELIATKLSQKIGVSTDKLLSQSSTKMSQTLANQYRAKPAIKLEMNDIRLAVAVLLANPALVDQVGDIDTFKQLKRPGVTLLLELIELIQSRPHLNTAQILERYREREESNALNKLAAYQFPNPDQDPNLLPKTFQDAISQLRRKAQEQRYDELLSKPTDQLTPSEIEEIKVFGRD